VFGIQAMMKPD